jgi:FdhD protein
MPTDQTAFVDGAIPYSYWTVSQHQSPKLTDGGVIEETLVSIYVNGQELATIMCSPLDLEALAVGFLYNEHVVDKLAEIGSVNLNVAQTTVDVMLHQTEFEPPRRMVLTSGCGGGITLQDLTEVHPPLNSEFQTTTEVILARMQDLQAEARLYNAVRGVHTAVLAGEDGVLVAAEDVGRHNAVDKVAGKALMSNIATRDRILLTSGRISSEMLNKARRMEVPVVASRTAPTSISVNLADTWNICIAGYVRRGSMRVYTHPERLAIG